MQNEAININHIISAQIKLQKENLTGIYFLLKDNHIVYIGKTTNGMRRILTHKDKDFDSYSFFKVKQHELDVVENLNIVYYKPIYNKQYTSSSFTGLSGINEKCRKKFGTRKMRLIRKVLKQLEFQKVIKVKNTISNDGRKITLINRDDTDLIVSEVEKLVNF